MAFVPKDLPDDCQVDTRGVVIKDCAVYFLSVLRSSGHQFQNLKTQTHGFNDMKF